MKIPFKPLPDDERPMDVPQFLRRLREEPGFAEKMRAHYEAALALPHSPDTEEMHAAARKALATLKHHQGAWHCKRLLQECLDAMGAPDFGGEPEDYVQLLAKTEEARDCLLDVQEPERSRFVEKVTRLRDEMERMMGRA